MGMEILNNEPNPDMFTIEHTGEENERKRNNVIIPKYSQCFSTAEEAPSGPAPPTRPKGLQCFNCLGPHNISDCPKPMNPGNINRNKREMRSNRVSNVRYHELFANKYGNFQPGKMSPALRNALGLRPDQVSEVAYRMRLLGYPPGWLMEARVHTGELEVYGGDGSALLQPDGEAGEVSGGAKYAPEKLVEFPGFNCPLPPDVVEEGHRYKVPGMQRCHRVDAWRRVMARNAVTPYRKRKMAAAAQAEEGEKRPKLDLEEGEDTDGEEAGNTTTDATINTTTDASTALDDSMMFIDTNPVDMPEDAQENEEESAENPDVTDGISSSADDSQSSNTCDSTDASEKKTKKKSRKSLSKGFVLGAAIPESITEFSQVPNSEAWTVDVTDHLLFENLPGYTGTYDKMRGIIKRVKDTMAKLHDDA